MGNQIISKIIKSESLPNKLVNNSYHSAAKLIDDLVDQNKSSSLFDIQILKKAQAGIHDIFTSGYNVTKTSVLIPVGLWGLKAGYNFPDMDISLLGIGNHRFFLFHSALGLVTLRYFYKQWLLKSTDKSFTNRVTRKVSGMILGTYSIGVGIHLAVDIFQPKSIVFPFFGSLVDGTLVDDNIWLLGNSLWAFKIGHDIITLTLADELETAKKYVKKRFGQQLNYNELEVIK
ncbi:MAG: hypothetical protein FIA82_05210 [Melioribacter sp.]|nr:hypothetical protein [Melioribacter sp.]